MEALGAAASIVGIVSLGIQLAQILQKQIGDVRDADERLLHIVIEIGATTTSLENLHELLRKDEDNPREQLFSQQGRNDIMVILRRCNAVFRNIIVLISKAGKGVLAVVDDFQRKTGKMKSIKDEGPILDIELSSVEHLMWPWKLPKIGQYIEDLNSFKLSLLLILAVAALAKKTISPYDSDASTFYDDEEDARLVDEVYYRDRECNEAGRWDIEEKTDTPAGIRKPIFRDTYQAAQMLVQNWPQLPDEGGYPSTMELEHLGVVLQAFAIRLPRLEDLSKTGSWNFWIEMPMTLGVIQDHILRDLRKEKASKTVWFAFANLTTYQQSAVTHCLDKIPYPGPESEYPGEPTLLNLYITKHRRQRLVERLKSLTPFYGHALPRSDLILVVAWIRKPPKAEIDPPVVLGTRSSADYYLKRPDLPPMHHQYVRSRSRERRRPRGYSYNTWDQGRNFYFEDASRGANSRGPVPGSLSYYDRELIARGPVGQSEKEPTTRRAGRREVSRSNSRSRSHSQSRARSRSRSRTRGRHYDQVEESAGEKIKYRPKQIGFHESTTEKPDPPRPANTRAIEYGEDPPNGADDNVNYHRSDREEELGRRQMDVDERGAGTQRSERPVRHPYRPPSRNYPEYERGETRYHPQVVNSNDSASMPFPQAHRLRYASSMPRTQTLPYYQDEQNYQPYRNLADWQVARIPPIANRGSTAQPWMPRHGTWNSNRPRPDISRRSTRLHERGHSFPYTYDDMGPQSYTPHAYDSRTYSYHPEDYYPSARPTTYGGWPDAGTTPRADTIPSFHDEDFVPSEEEKMSCAQYYISKWTNTISRMRQRLSSRRLRSYHGNGERPEPFPMRPKPADRQHETESRERREDSPESEGEKALHDSEVTRHGE
ncbi:Serine/arginine repetitive matrix protein 2 [Lambiella insularis]|nr:Serine/arginine repetitive matrix protein 2 [Lambiella insularis]